MIRSAINVPFRINIKSTVLPVHQTDDTKQKPCPEPTPAASLEDGEVLEAPVNERSAASRESEDDDSGSTSSESLTSTIISTTQHLPERTAEPDHKHRKRKKEKKHKKKSKHRKSKRKRGDESSDEDSSSWSQVFRKKTKRSKSSGSSWYDLPEDAISDPKTEAVRDWIKQSETPVESESPSRRNEDSHRPAGRSDDDSFKRPDDPFKKPAELPSTRHDRRHEYERRHRDVDDVRDRRRPDDDRCTTRSRHRQQDHSFRDRDRRRDESHRSVSVSRSTRSVSRARRIYTEEEKIDKAKLLAIARANLSCMMRMGTLPKGVDVERFKLRHLKELAASKSVKEYTEFCRAISAMEAAAYSDSSLSASDDSDDDVRSVISEATFAGKHPFVLKERKEIQINVRDFVPRMPRTAKEIQSVLLDEFPVDSGDKHRRQELEWTDVSEMTAPTSLPVKERSKKTADKIREQPDDSLAFRKGVPEATTSTASESVVPELLPAESTSKFDVGSIMSQRLSAMRVLQSDPFNVVALKQMRQSQEMDTLRNTKAIKGGIGKHLMEKMGWKEGQGLGLKKQGSLEPILPSIKLDTKGLATEGETVKSLAQQVVACLPVCEADRAPVAILHTYCLSKQYAVPMYELVEESGPAHKKHFVMRVLVNEIFYQPTVSSPTKKQAKHLAATVCLQAFGLLPKEPPKVKLITDSQ